MEFFCEELQKIAERVFNNEPAEYDIVCNVSPGTSKSTIWSILFHPWVWTRMPNARFISASHTDSLVLDLASKSRDVIKSDLYRMCYPEIEMASTQDSKGYFRNTLGGDRFACTVGGKTPMGMHAHFLLGDDLLDPMKALSEAETQNAANFITNYLPTRMVDKLVSVMALVMQRLGRGDPTEVMLAMGNKEGARPVRHICLPAELFHNGKDRISPPELAEHYSQDNLMDPVRLPRSVLRAYRARGEHYYAAQFLQDPMSLGGGMFKETYFTRRVKAAPYNAKRIRYWDRASSIASGACATAGVLLAKSPEGDYYIENVVRGHWEPKERNDKMLATAQRDRARYGPNNTPIIYIENEGGSSGVDAWQSIAKVLEGFIVRKDQPTGSKDVRAEPWSCQLAAGNVYIVDDGTWDVAEFVKEHCVLGGTLILTNKGVKRAEEIREGDMVLTHKGRFREVEVVESRIASSVRCISSKMLDDLFVTGEHPVLCMKTSKESGEGKHKFVSYGVDWKLADEVSEGWFEKKYGTREKRFWDSVVIPVFSPDREIPSIDLRRYYDYATKINRWGHCEFVDDGESIRPATKKSQAVKYMQTLDFAFGRFCGLYLAEASYTNGQIQFAFHAKETVFHREVRDFLLQKLGMRSQISSSKRTPNTVVISSGGFRRLKKFFSTFGFGAGRKKIPIWAWDAPEEFQKGIIEGWLDGDGGCTVSRNLAWGMRVLLSRQGKWPFMQMRKDLDVPVVINGEVTGYSNREAYYLNVKKEGSRSVVRRDGGYLGMRVNSNEEKKGEVRVWNFQVREDNSYTTTGGCVHNCLFKPEAGKRLGRFKDQVDAAAAAFNLLAGKKKPGTLYVHRTGGDKKKGLRRIIVCSREELPNVIVEDHFTLFVSIQDPLQTPELPPHPFAKLLDSQVMQFADLDPEEHQEEYDKLIDPYEMTVDKLVMQQEQGKRLWAMLTKRRDPAWEVLVIQDDDNGLALSVAVGVLETQGWERSIMTVVSEPESVYKDPAPNPHVFRVVKATRSMVI